MITKVRFAAAASLLSILAIAAAPSSAKPAPQPVPQGPGFFPCSFGMDQGKFMERLRNDCLAKAANAVQIVRARQSIITQNPGEAGCLDKDLGMCIASLARTLVVSTRRYLDPHIEIPIEAKLDINGRPIEGFELFDADIPGTDPAARHMGVAVKLADGIHVSSIDFELPNPPQRARTVEEWNATGVYEIATAVLGPECIGPDRSAFYRRVDALQKGATSTQTSTGYYGNRTVGSSSVGVDRICGKIMMVSEAGGFSSQTGAFGGSGLTFKNDGAAQRESKPAAPSIAASDPTGGAVSQVPAGVPAQEQPQKGADGATAKGSFGFTFIPTVLGGLITAVASDSPAAMAGVKPGEIIEAMNGKSIKGMAPAAITALLGRSGGSITLSVAGVGDVKVTKHQ